MPETDSSAATLAPAPKKATRIQSAARAVNLLTLVAAGKTNGSGKELAEAAGLAVPTAHHLLATLVAEGFLTQDERSRYLLGPKIALLADAFQRDLTPPSYLLAPLQRLVATTRETAYLARWSRGEIHLLSGIEGSQTVRVTAPEGPYRDAHARASGKLFLAHVDDEVRDAYLLSHPLRKLTEHTITSRRRLLDEFTAIREQGYATEEEELQVGLSCVATPVREDDVIVAVYSLAVPTQRFRAHRRELVDAAMDAALSAVTRR